MGDFGIGAAVRRKEDFRFLTGTGHLHRRHQPARPAPCLSTTQPPRSCGARHHRHGCRQGGAWRRRGLHRRRSASGRPSLRLARHLEGRQADGRAAASTARAGQGAPCRRPGGSGRRRDARAGEGRGRADRRSATRTLPAVVASDEAIKPGSPLLFDTAPGNLCFDWHLGDKAAVDAAFARAHHITRLDLVNNRLVSNPMEPRAATGEFDRATGDYTLYTTSQAPHVASAADRRLRAAAARAQAARGGARCRRRLRHQGLALCRAGAGRSGSRGKLGRPVKWTAERSEIFLTDNQARDHLTKAELALDKRRQIPRHARRHAGQSRRLSRQLRAGDPDLVLRHPARRQLRDAARSMSRSRASSPTPRRSTPIAARGGRRPATSWSASSTAPRAR